MLNKISYNIQKILSNTKNKENKTKKNKIKTNSKSKIKENSKNKKSLLSNKKKNSKKVSQQNNFSLLNNINNEHNNNNSVRNNLLSKNNKNNLQKLALKIINTNKNIVLLKKNSFDIWYNTEVKYPILVRECLKYKKVDKIIERRFIEDPFKLDKEIKKNQQLTPEEYKKFMVYGGSFGHNAPAGNHKIDEQSFNDTFLMTNITPQEMVFNSGLWVILENYCKSLMKNKNINNINIFTGSFINKKNTKLVNPNKTSSSLKINIPTHMYKIIICKHKEHSNNIYINAYLMENRPSLINKDLQYMNMGIFSVSYKHICNVVGINLENLLSYYNLNPYQKKILPLSKIHYTKYKLPPILHLQIHKNYYFFKIIYAKDLDDLETQWEECQKYESKFGDLKYHKEYYELTKKRLNKDLEQVFYKK